LNLDPKENVQLGARKLSTVQSAEMTREELALQQLEIEKERVKLELEKKEVMRRMKEVEKLAKQLEEKQRKAKETETPRRKSSIAPPEKENKEKRNKSREDRKDRLFEGAKGKGTFIGIDINSGIFNRALEDANRFWIASSFPLTKKVEWNVMEKALYQLVFRRALPTTHHLRKNHGKSLGHIKYLIDYTNSGKTSRDNLVSLEDFGRFLSYFGPLPELVFKTPIQREARYDFVRLLSSEIVLKIFSYVRRNYSSYEACSLVSRKWYKVWRKVPSVLCPAINFLDNVESLSRQTYFYGRISPEEAEEIVSKEQLTFILRCSTSTGHLTATCRFGDDIVHQRILHLQSGYVLKKRVFPTVHQLVVHYYINPKNKKDKKKKKKKKDKKRK